MAVVQLRDHTEGRAYYDREVAAGKSSMEAMRCLERRLFDVVYRQLPADTLQPVGMGLPRALPVAPKPVDAAVVEAHAAWRGIPQLR